MLIKKYYKFTLLILHMCRFCLQTPNKLSSTIVLFLIITHMGRKLYKASGTAFHIQYSGKNSNIIFFFNLDKTFVEYMQLFIFNNVYSLSSVLYTITLY